MDKPQRVRRWILSTLVAEGVESMAQARQAQVQLAQKEEVIFSMDGNEPSFN